MIIELHHNDGSVEPREIARTELTAPTVLKTRDKFFIKSPCDPRLCTIGPKHLMYRECRGENLNSIEIVRTPNSEEVLA